MNCNLHCLQVSQWKCFSLRVLESRFPLAHSRNKCVGYRNRDSGREFSVGVVSRISSICYPQCSYFPSSWGFFAKRTKCNSLLRLKDCSENMRQRASILFVRLVTGVMLVMSVSLASSEPSCESPWFWATVQIQNIYGQWFFDRTFFRFVLTLYFSFLVLSSRGAVWRESSLSGGVENNWPSVYW